MREGEEGERESEWVGNFKLGTWFGVSEMHVK